ncbi:MAG: alpha-glucuronidase, partial [Pseudolactococcus laudensis]
MSTRDNCWLTKKIKNPHYQTYFLAGDSPLEKTIETEFSALFAAARKVEKKSDAALIFNIVANETLGQEGFDISKTAEIVTVSATTPQGLLYGFYH